VLRQGVWRGFGKCSTESGRALNQLGLPEGQARTASSRGDAKAARGASGNPRWPVQKPLGALAGSVRTAALQQRTPSPPGCSWRNQPSTSKRAHPAAGCKIANGCEL